MIATLLYFTLLYFTLLFFFFKTLQSPSSSQLIYPPYIIITPFTSNVKGYGILSIPKYIHIPPLKV